MKPNERAKSLFNNAFYFTGSYDKAIELCLYICIIYIDYARRMDDKVYWLEVRSEIEKI